ncbi:MULTISPECIES: hypothetical protein [Candidatus Ichthyocystis]|uniref:Uncharacterized protein n=1 Tax=Candidatus Ichthyocystis hellenicum TaxID=1561003 RepID=A0A0S4M3D5_9BURK|nr:MULTISPECIES: hypothetical protein [Ichthyocystis]CUT18281.1 hypothetical protein Ark11_1483 [Candidatus Ichthyocystis hellenicum]
MYSYLILGSNSNVDGVDKKENIKSEDNDISTDNLSYQNKYVTNNGNYDFNTGILTKNGPPYDFLNLHDSGELFQEDDFQKRLFPPDIFKLSKLDECNLLSKTKDFYTDKPCTSRTLKRMLVEDVSSTLPTKTKRINPKPISDNEKSHIFEEEMIKVPEPIIKKDLDTRQITEKDTFIGDETPSISADLGRAEIKQIPSKEENQIKKNLILKLYTRSKLWHKKTNSLIVYRDAVKKINIDSNKLFENNLLEKIDEIIKKKSSLKSSVDLSPTYSSIRKFTLDKISSLFDDNEIDPDMLITPGMSISDIRSSCISNNMFFKKLRKYCEKIEKDVREIPDNCLSHVLQCRVILNINDHSNSANTEVKLYPPKNKFLSKLKELIIDTISNLPNSIICELEKTDQKNIVNALFVDMHGVLVSKSLIKNMNLLFDYNKNKFANKRFDDNLNLFNEMLEKIVNIVKVSCIFHEGVFLPDEPTTEKLSRYLLSDMYGIPFKFHEKLKLYAQSTLKIDNFILDSNYAKGVSAIKMEINDNCDSDLIATTSVVSNVDQSEKGAMIKEFSLKSYCKDNLFSASNTSNIYEDAIKKIIIDNNCRFKNRALEELGSFITSRGFTNSYLNLSKTYSNVRKYVLDKVTPFINDAVTNADVLINPGMSLSDLAYNLLSNGTFFERLSKNCEEIVKGILSIPNHYFLRIVQSYVYLSATERLRINKKKKKLCPDVKLLIIETISNLPYNITHEIRKLNPNEIADRLFTNIHGVNLPKSLVRRLESIFNSSKIPGNKSRPNLNLLNCLFAKILSEIKTCPVLHKEKIFYLGKSTAKILSKYFLSDMYNIHDKIHKKISLHKHSIENTPESDYEKSSATNNDDSMESPLLEKTILIPQKKLKWDTDLISPLNIYKSALLMIDIDKSDFECSFIDKVRNYPVVIKYISEKEKINIDLSITYDHVRKDILKKFSPFLKEIEEEIRAKIKPVNGMTVDKLRLAYVSNEENFLDKLSEFCTKMINSINNSSNYTLTYMMQCVVSLGTETQKVIRLDKKRKISLHKEIANLLIRNILNVPKVIVSMVKLIPNTKFIEEYFSNFYDIYVDNISLLKAKSVFDGVHKKVVNDCLLIKIADKISLDMVNKKSTERYITPKIVNRYIACRELSTYKYIRKLIKEDIQTLKYKLVDPIMIIRNDKIEAADQKTRDKILINLESDLIETTIKSYHKLCTKKYRTYKSKNGY